VSMTKAIGSTIAVGFVIFVLAVALYARREVRAAADHSAHAAITAEICDQLGKRASTGSFPRSLSELPLVFPDGGDASLLTRFTYESTGTNCTLRTHLGTHELVRSFPQ